MVGLAGVSICTILMDGSFLSASSTNSIFRISTIVVLIPVSPKTLCINSCVPPYNEKWERMVSPVFNVLKKSVAIAAWPLACNNAFTFIGLPSSLVMPNVSSAAMVSSAVVNVGLPQRL